MKKVTKTIRGTDAFNQKFEIEGQINQPETLEEAIKELGKEKVFKIFKNEYTTNQMDTLRKAELSRRNKAIQTALSDSEKAEQIKGILGI